MRLTAKQLAALEMIIRYKYGIDGYCVDHRVGSCPEPSTMRSLVGRGLVCHEKTSFWRSVVTITDAGRTALASQRQKD